MQYLVLKPFKTPTRRIPEGVLVDDNELDGPLTAMDWVERGYLEAPPPADQDLIALRDEAAMLGVEFDRRWGKQRLRDAIEAQKAINKEIADANAAAATAEAAAAALAEAEAAQAAAAEKE